MISEIASERGQKFLADSPVYYRESAIYRAIALAVGLQFDGLRDALEGAFDQRFVTKVSWAIGEWERELGLSPYPGQPLEERRDRVVSRLRGLGTATNRVVKAVAESFAFSEVDVIEDPEARAVMLRFVGERGRPSSLEDVLFAVRAVLPAHLELFYEFVFLTWADLEQRGWTWDQLEGIAPGGPAGAPITWDELEVLL